MRAHIFSLFPEVFQPYLGISILKRAIQNGLLDVQTHDIREWATDRHHTTDDTPYGGGGGMVMKPEPVFAAVESTLGAPPRCPVILLCPQGRVFSQQIARELAAHQEIALIAGRYEAFDERIREHLVSDVLSIGDYILTGGELPALVVLDALARLQPGVLGDNEATSDDSFSESGLLEYPQYTKPPVFRGWEVPEVLQNGNVAKQLAWKRQQMLLRTLRQRPELLAGIELSKKDISFLKEYLFEHLQLGPSDLMPVNLKEILWK
ncbi:MAG: tRNA (guanosine(37)-N1)-methyltransferase TrmD [Anaerolineaceae bacterium]|nr:tRNA (guanosine(37)-N1)-methyltransferase TrmD [Anaerolineaceae bacterium]